jgi:hypothetical protein
MFVALVAPFHPAQAVIIDFEGFTDSTPLTTQLPDLTFTNAAIISAGITLNQFEFPPRSGINVVFVDGGPLRIVFGTPQASVGGFFTYAAPLTLTAFDDGNESVATATSAFLSNLALSGDPGSSANEFLAVAFNGGIRSVTVLGDPLGGSFALDDLTITPAPEHVTPVPEPSTLLLLVTGLASAMASRRVRGKKNH